MATDTLIEPFFLSAGCLWVQTGLQGGANVLFERGPGSGGLDHFGVDFAKALVTHDQFIARVPQREEFGQVPDGGH